MNTYYLMGILECFTIIMSIVLPQQSPALSPPGAQGLMPQDSSITTTLSSKRVSIASIVSALPMVSQSLR